MKYTAVAKRFPKRLLALLMVLLVFLGTMPPYTAAAAFTQGTSDFHYTTETVLPQNISPLTDSYSFTVHCDKPDYQIGAWMGNSSGSPSWSNGDSKTATFPSNADADGWYSTTLTWDNLTGVFDTLGFKIGKNNPWESGEFSYSFTLTGGKIDKELWIRPGDNDNAIDTTVYDKEYKFTIHCKGSDYKHLGAWMSSSTGDPSWSSSSLTPTFTSGSDGWSSATLHWVLKDSFDRLGFHIGKTDPWSTDASNGRVSYENYAFALTGDKVDKELWVVPDNTKIYDSQAAAEGKTEYAFTVHCKGEGYKIGGWMGHTSGTPEWTDGDTQQPTFTDDGDGWYSATFNWALENKYDQLGFKIGKENYWENPGTEYKHTFTVADDKAAAELWVIPDDATVYTSKPSTGGTIEYAFTVHCYDTAHAEHSVKGWLAATSNETDQNTPQTQTTSAYSGDWAALSFAWSETKAYGQLSLQLDSDTATTYTHALTAGASTSTALWLIPGKPTLYTSQADAQAALGTEPTSTEYQFKVHCYDEASAEHSVNGWMAFYDESQSKETAWTGGQTYSTGTYTDGWAEVTTAFAWSDATAYNRIVFKLDGQDPQYVHDFTAPTGELWILPGDTTVYTSQADAEAALGSRPTPTAYQFKVHCYDEASTEHSVNGWMAFYDAAQDKETVWTGGSTYSTGTYTDGWAEVTTAFAWSDTRTFNRIIFRLDGQDLQYSHDFTGSSGELWIIPGNPTVYTSQADAEANIPKAYDFTIHCKSDKYQKLGAWMAYTDGSEWNSSLEVPFTEEADGWSTTTLHWDLLKPCNKLGFTISEDTYWDEKGLKYEYSFTPSADGTVSKELWIVPYDPMPIYDPDDLDDPAVQPTEPYDPTFAQDGDPTAPREQVIHKSKPKSYDFTIHCYGAPDYLVGAYMASSDGSAKWDDGNQNTYKSRTPFFLDEGNGWSYTKVHWDLPDAFDTLGFNLGRYESTIWTEGKAYQSYHFDPSGDAVTGEFWIFPEDEEGNLYASAADALADWIHYTIEVEQPDVSSSIADAYLIKIIDGKEVWIKGKASRFQKAGATAKTVATGRAALAANGSAISEGRQKATLSWDVSRAGTFDRVEFNVTTTDKKQKKTMKYTYPLPPLEESKIEPSAPGSAIPHTVSQSLWVFPDSSDVYSDPGEAQHIDAELVDYKFILHYYTPEEEDVQVGATLIKTEIEDKDDSDPDAYSGSLTSTFIDRDANGWATAELNWKLPIGYDKIKYLIDKDDPWSGDEYTNTFAWDDTDIELWIAPGKDVWRGHPSPEEALMDASGKDPWNLGRTEYTFDIYYYGKAGTLGGWLAQVKSDKEVAWNDTSVTSAFTSVGEQWSKATFTIYGDREDYNRLGFQIGQADPWKGEIYHLDFAGHHAQAWVIPGDSTLYPNKPEAETALAYRNNPYAFTVHCCGKDYALSGALSQVKDSQTRSDPAVKPLSTRFQGYANGWATAKLVWDTKGTFNRLSLQVDDSQANPTSQNGQPASTSYVYDFTGKPKEIWLIPGDSNVYRSRLQAECALNGTPYLAVTVHCKGDSYWVGSWLARVENGTETAWGDTVSTSFVNTSYLNTSTATGTATGSGNGNGWSTALLEWSPKEAYNRLTFQISQEEATLWDGVKYQYDLADNSAADIGTADASAVDTSAVDTADTGAEIWVIPNDPTIYTSQAEAEQAHR